MSKSDPLVSIIVPAYNAEKSIMACIQSLTEQTYSNLEIIIVNDGSKDGTAEIVNSVATRDNRIVLLEQDNGGQTKARAHGVSCARGEWITFVDSDDKLVSNAVERFVDVISSDVDIVVGFSYENNEPLHKIGIQDWRASLIKSDIILCTPWGKLFRRSILVPQVFELYTANKTATDMPMNIKISFSTEKDVLVIPGKVYEYYVVSDSLSRSAKWTIEKISNLYKDVYLSIPEGQRETYLRSLIENRIIALERSTLELDRYARGIIGKSEYVNSLRNDVKRLKYKTGVVSYMLIWHPDSYMTQVLVRAKRKSLIIRQFIHRIVKR